MRVFFPTLMMVVALSGCAHRFTPEKVGLVIVDGKTTKQEILAAFGAPDKKLKTPGMKMLSRTKEYVIQNPREVWLYSPHQLKLLDSLEPETLKIIFNEAGVVVRYDFSTDD
jgi:hypothetical protein